MWGSEARSLEDFSEDITADIHKIEINSGRTQLAKELNVFGFGETMIFPDLPNLAIEISRTEGWRINSEG